LPCSGTRTKQSDPGTTKLFFRDFEICLQADCRGSAFLVLVPEQAKQIARDLLVLFWSRNKTSRLSITKNRKIWVSCSGARTGQADCPGPACLVLAPEQDKQIARNLLVFFWSQDKETSKFEITKKHI